MVDYVPGTPMRFSELVDLCGKYCDSCEVMVYMHYKMANEWRLLSIKNFGIREDTQYQLTNMQNYANEIKFIEIRPELLHILWEDIVFE